MIKQNIPLTIANLRKLNQHIMDNFVKAKSDKMKLQDNKDIYWVEGYLCALVSSPEPMISMDDWIPHIHGDCDFKSEQHLTDIMSMIFSLRNDIAKRLNDKSFRPLYEKHNIENQPQQDLIMSWCKGYMHATFLFHGWVLQDKDKAEISQLLFPVIVGTGTYGNNNLNENDVLKEDVLQVIPRAIEMFYEFSSDIINNSVSQSEKDIATPIVNDHKIGRNDPCLCGSGKKYKKCCLATNRTLH